MFLVQRLIARHNGTSDDHDNPSTQPSHMGHEYGDKLNHDTHASTLHTPQPTPHSHYDDMDASYSFSPSPEVEESDGEVGGEDSAYSPALFSAHDGAPLLLDSIEDMYIGQGGPATYATITTTGSLVNLPDSDSPSVLAHTPAHEPVHIHTHTHTPHLTHTDSAAAAHKRDRYTLPFSMDSMDDLYMQIVEMDNRNTHTHTQSRTHTSNRARGHAHVPMSPSRCLLTNMLSSFQPTQHEGQEAPIFIVPQLAANTSEMSVDSGMITHNHTSTSVTHDNPSVKLTQTSIRSTSNTPKSARYPSKMSEQSHFTNFSPGGHVDGMEEAFELSP
ncbi:hypothetical protein EON63_00300 [archaeon]|nr:MAG: hypothetical protein EON63_00300 [archaeon]